MRTLTFSSVVLLSMVLINCSNIELDDTKANPFEPSLDRIGANLILDGNGDYEKVITVPLVKTDDCKYIVSGIIEYWLNGELLAVVDYGNGECDAIATKTTAGTTSEFSLDKSDLEDKKANIDKIITSPLVKIEGCEYVVEGTVQYLEDDIVVATIDYGNGECDEWATKTNAEGTFSFSLADKK